MIERNDREIKLRMKELIIEIKIINKLSEYQRIKNMNMIIYKMRLLREYQYQLKYNQIEELLKWIKEN